jgi:hypothetical protein
MECAPAAASPCMASSAVTRIRTALYTSLSPKVWPDAERDEGAASPRKVNPKQKTLVAKRAMAIQLDYLVSRPGGILALTEFFRGTGSRG